MEPTAYGKQLEAEMARAAAVIGAEFLWPGYLAGELPDEDELAANLSALFRDLKPDIVVTHWHGSWHARHVQAHRAVVKAVGLMAKSGEKAVPWVLFGENCEDLDGFVPDVYVDVTHTAQKAWQAMGEYELFKREWSPDAAGRTVRIPYEQYYRAMAAVRGIEAGVRYAQAFRMARSVISLTTLSASRVLLPPR